MKDLIKRYLKIKIETMKKFNKQLARQEKVIKTLAITVANMNILVDEHLDESYKTKFLNEHKKFKEYEKESKQIIEELTKALKEAQK